MNASTDQILKLLGRELLLRRKYVLAIVLIVNLAAVIVGLAWSKAYVSSTTIFVEDKNILDPLMQGAAVRTSVTDRSRIAKEVIYGRAVMDQLADGLGLYNDSLTDVEKERIVERLRGRTTVTQAGRGLIRIEHKGDNPKEAFKATAMLAELFITGSHEDKLEQSKAAYEFIDKQVAEYREKLQAAEEILKNLRTSNLQAGIGGGEANIITRINQIMTRIDQVKEQLREAEIKKTSLERQLSGETESTVVVTRVGRMRTRISELQAQLTTMRQTYQDAHPDIVRVRHQIDDLHESLKAEEQRRQQSGQGAVDSGGYSAVDEGVVHNPLYQQLRVELAQTKILIDTLKARLAEANQQFSNEQNRGKSLHSGDATLAEVTRDYQANNAQYQDLLRRREQALVSMNINKERQGLGFAIQEKAELPLKPSGLQFRVVLIIGFLLSLLVPCGLLFALVQFDPRIRLASVVTDQLKIPMLAVVPHLWSPQEVQHLNNELRWSVVAGLWALGSVIFLMLLQFFRVI
jgi:polysaccharide chain length determinant protein (PEP-CTERM system associated)